MEGTTEMGGTPIEHLLLIFTIFGTMSIGAYTATKTDCEELKATIERTIELHNQELPRRYKKVENMMVCVKVDKD